MLAEDWHVRLLEDESEIAGPLEQDRRWTAYALCDLDPPYRERARFIGAETSGSLGAIVLLYRLPRAHALLCFGDVAGVQAIFESYQEFPQAAFIIVRPEYLPALERRYRVEDSWIVVRMVLAGKEIREPARAGERLARLTVSDIPALRELYRLWPSTFFDAEMFESGVHWGAFDGPQLIAAAGTHVVSPRRGIAAIGGVFTHPSRRARGFATATTGAVVKEILGRGIDLVVLNVARENEAAQIAYRRLGFTAYHDYVEGHADLHTVPAPSVP
jgi:ribosomal protein S18 acetylase RimI-like enzyme